MAEQTMSQAKRKRLLKTYGSCPAGYTPDDLERFLDLLYGMYRCAVSAHMKFLHNAGGDES